MNRAHRLKASDEAAEAFKALPESFDAGLTIAFTREKAAEHGDAADHLAHGGRFLGWRLPCREPSRLPFERIKYRDSRQIGMDARQPGQMCQTPSHHEIEAPKASSSFLMSPSCSASTRQPFLST